MTASQYSQRPRHAGADPVGAERHRRRLQHPGRRLRPEVNGSVLAGIFSGKITNWNNSAILKLNPHFKSALKRAGRITPVVPLGRLGRLLRLPALPDGCRRPCLGTTATAPAGARRPASARTATPASPARSAHNRGTIGYISAYYLINQHITTAAIENAREEVRVPAAQ